MHSIKSIFQACIIILSAQAINAETTNMVVFVHGSHVGVPKNITFIKKMLKTHILAQLTGPQGLHLIEKHLINSNYSEAHKICARYETLCQHTHKKEKRCYYTFSWCGDLKASSRLKAAERLLHELKQVYQILKTKHPTNTINLTLIGHSNGGNVLLNLAQSIGKQKLPFTAHQLVLLGTPLHQNALKMASHPFFTNVINIYSQGDLLQICDIISNFPRTSARTFSRLAKRGHSPLPTKIYDVRIHINGWKPNHQELWKSNKTPHPEVHKNFPLAPYPTVVLVPHILAYLQNQKPVDRHIAFHMYTRHTQDDFYATTQPII